MMDSESVDWSNAVKKFVLATLVMFVSLNALAASKTARRPLPAPPAQQGGQVAPSPALVAMGQELDRELPILTKASPAAYFIDYILTSTDRTEVMGSNGALLSSEDSRSRWLETQVRVGSSDLDNTHKVGNSQPNESSFGTSVPLDDAPDVLRRTMWMQTDKQYRSASEALIKINTSKEVQSQTAEEHAPDFSREQPHTFYGPEVSVHPDRKPWEAKVRLYTGAFRASPQIMNSIVTFSAEGTNQYQVNSEGTHLQFGQIHYRLELYIQGKAPDGMDINRYYNFDWTNPADAPDDKTVLAEEQVIRKELEALVAAPLVEPYAGPALLTGRATAVFFHEVFGHRAEGFRQKDINEGQTFARKVGEQILPTFLSIYDDPTAKTLGNAVNPTGNSATARLGDMKGMLLGYYPFDDEGVPAERVTLVDHGILKNFEMSRQALSGFPQSNGHGRRQVGAEPVSRQGNLIVQSSLTVTNAQLRVKLIEEIKRQGKTFGLMIDDIAGGFTFTGRGQPQAFQVQPLVVYKVFADGRPDELVRGVDIVGTPLVSLTKIIATGDTMEVFNGYCGAESGSVPVAAAAPAILISEMEVQKKETSTDKPPILPPPGHDTEGALR
jgi:TldD protein